MGWYGKRRWADDRRLGPTRRGQSRGHARSSGTLRVAERDAKLRPTRLKAPLTSRGESGWGMARPPSTWSCPFTRHTRGSDWPASLVASCPALDRRRTACRAATGSRAGCVVSTAARPHGYRCHGRRRSAVSARATVTDRKEVTVSNRPSDDGKSRMLRIVRGVCANVNG